MQNETATTESSELGKGLALSAYVGAKISESYKGAVGIGFHGYFVTDEIAKRGYGLKNMLPSALGYVKGDSKQLCRVEQVFDGVWGEHLREDSATVVVGMIIAATHVLTLGIEREVRSVFVGVPRVRLAAMLASGCAPLRKSNFKDSHGTEIPYKDYVEAYIRAFDILSEKGVTVTVENALETDMGVLSADGSASLALLNAGREGSIQHLSMVTADGYWNHVHGRHPLLGHQRLLFSATKDFKELPEYLYTMDYEKATADKKDKHKLEIEVGQNLAHARYAVVRPHNNDPLLNEVARRHCQHHRTKHSNLSILYLVNLFSKQGHSMLERFGSDVLVSKTHLTELLDGRDVMYTHDMPIPRRSLRSAQVFAKMEHALKEFEAARAANPSDLLTFDCALGAVTAFEISDLLAVVTENNKGKCTYKPSKAMELPNLTMDVMGHLVEGEELKKIPIRLTLGYDIPPRNTVAALLDEDFRAFVLVYRDTEVTVRHLTVILSSKGNGIWTTPFAARTFTHNKP